MAARTAGPPVRRRYGVLSLTAATALAVVLAVAAWGKVRSRRAFAAFTTALGQFGVPAASAARSRRWCRRRRSPPWCAGAAGAAGGPVRTRGGAAVPSSAALLRAGRGGRAIACHCFGSDAPARLGPHVAVNAALVLLAVAAALPGPAAGTAGDRVSPSDSG